MSIESKPAGPSLAPLYKLTEGISKKVLQKAGAASSTAQVIELKRGSKSESVTVNTQAAAAEKISYLKNLNDTITNHHLRNADENPTASESEVNEILSDLGKALGEAKNSGAVDPATFHKLDVARALDLLKDD